MRAPEARAKIWGGGGICLQTAYDVIIFKFQGGASAPPCTPLPAPMHTYVSYILEIVLLNKLSGMYSARTRRWRGQLSASRPSLKTTSSLQHSTNGYSTHTYLTWFYAPLLYIHVFCKQSLNSVLNHILQS